MSDTRLRLYLVGDDDALDVLAELCQHLAIAEISRTDLVPQRKLDAQDIIVIGVRHPRTRAGALRDALARGPAKHVALLADNSDASPTGARAILTAAELVAVLFPEIVTRSE